MGDRGNDLLSFRGAVDQESYFFGDSGADTIVGGRQADSIYGGTGNDELIGGSGSDLLFGGEGSDLMNGGAGSDILRSGGGHDTMTGGRIADVFIFDGENFADISGVWKATITDFTFDRVAGDGRGDALDIWSVTLIGFDPFSGANQARLRQDGADCIVEVQYDDDDPYDLQIRLVDIDAEQFAASGGGV